MGAMIHSYGVRRLGTDRAVLMFHEAAGSYQGQTSKMKSMMYMIDRYIDKMEANVFKRSKMSKLDYDQHILKDFWVDTEDAKEIGLIDDLVVLNTVGFVIPVNQIFLKQNAPSEDFRFLPDFRMLWKL
jgi:ATP-dependent protease ClpP protease subunit